MQSAVERAIAAMWDRYDEPLSLSELADAAIMSRFHFSRIFRSYTGTSPCRFLAAVRLSKAKGILLESSRNVTDIAYEVGYNSLGTFTSRFTKSVGVSPARYRQLSRIGIPAPLPVTVPGAGGAVRGLLSMPESARGMPLRVYVGAFDSPIAQGVPAACDILDTPGTYRLREVPDGQWYIRAAAVAVRDVDPRPWVRKPVLVGAAEPVRVRHGVVEVDMPLHPLGPLDLPVLVALPELDGGVLPPAGTPPVARAVAPPMPQPLAQPVARDRSRRGLVTLHDWA